MLKLCSCLFVLSLSHNKDTLHIWCQNMSSPNSPVSPSANAAGGSQGSQSTVKLGLYVPGLVRTFGYYVLSVDHGHCQSAFFALSLFWIKRTLFRKYLYSFPLRVRNNRVSLYAGNACICPSAASVRRWIDRGRTEKDVETLAPAI